MASQKKNSVKVPVILLALLTSDTFAQQGNDKTLASIPASQSPAPASPAKPPHPEHVKLAGNHMLKLHQDLKRFPTRAEFVKHLEKEMKITEAQAEKILVEMDID